MVHKLSVAQAPAVLFKIFYFLTKINGLLPITITFEPLSASYSVMGVCYTILYMLILVVCILCAQSTVIEYIGILHSPKLTIILVFLIQVAFSAFRIGTIYFSQILNYKNLSNFIERSARINQMLTKGNKQQTFLDFKLSKWCISKFISTICQVILMLVPAFGFVSKIKSSEHFLLLLTCYLFILYTHIVLILSTGIYFSGMIVIGQFYRNLNSRIYEIRRKVTVPNVKSLHNICDSSHEFDEFTAILYSDVTNHATNFHKYQRCFASVSLTHYFVIILAEVCPCFFPFLCIIFFCT